MSARVNYRTLSTSTVRRGRIKQGPGNLNEDLFLYCVAPCLKTVEKIGLCKEFNSIFSREQSKVVQRLKAYRPIQILFQNHLEEGGSPGAYLNRLNGQIQELWGKFFLGGYLERRKIEREFQHVDKAVSAERLEKHVDELAQRVLQLRPATLSAKSHRGVEVARNIVLVLLSLQIVMGIALLILGISTGMLLLFAVPFGLFVAAIGCVLTLGNENPLVEEYLGRSLLEVQQELSPTVILP